MPAGLLETTTWELTMPFSKTPSTHGITNIDNEQATLSKSPNSFAISPPAAATAKRGRDGTWGWTVAACPHCGKKHFHGGGDGERPAFLGHRISHCITGKNVGYVLVEAGI
jgi:hypothetical protein